MAMVLASRTLAAQQGGGAGQAWAANMHLGGRTWGSLPQLGELFWFYHLGTDGQYHTR